MAEKMQVVDEPGNVQGTTSAPASSCGVNLRRHLTVRSRERCLNKLRSEDLNKLSQFCKLHISFLIDMGNRSNFEDLFDDVQPITKSNIISSLLNRKRTSIGGK